MRTKTCLLCGQELRWFPPRDQDWRRPKVKKGYWRHIGHRGKDHAPAR